MRYKLRIGIRYKIKDKPIDFTKFQKEIFDAVFEFNGSNSDKEISVDRININTIDLIVDIDKPVFSSLKELSAFSRKLVPTLQEFSNVPGKLFKTIAVREVDNEILSIESEIKNVTTYEYDAAAYALKQLYDTRDIGSPKRKQQKEEVIFKISQLLSEII